MGTEGQYVGLCFIHECGELRHLGTQLIGDLAPLLARGLGIVLNEGGADEGGDYATALATAWASTLRMKCTGQRCQVACRTLAMAALMPSWASEITSLTPRRTRRASWRKNSYQFSEVLTHLDITARAHSAQINI
jgi:hypothetical protein